MDSYEKQQERLQKLMEECLVENEDATFDYDDKSDQDEDDDLEVDDHNSDSEQDVSDNEIVHESPVAYFIGKDKISKWNKHAPRKNVRKRKENIIKHFPGAKSATKNVKSILEIWQHFLDPDMIHEIVLTNKHIDSVQDNYSRNRDAKHTNVCEIQGLIGLIYLSSRLKSNRPNVDELWSTKGSGVELFRLAMGKKGFCFYYKTYDLSTWTLGRIEK
ncbi:hypothetical protein PPYR_01641, partial [Photinus pyralis]